MKHPLRHLACWTNYERPDSFFCLHCGIWILRDDWHNPAVNDKTRPCPSLWAKLPFWKRWVGGFEWGWRFL